ncbi:MAG: hypothetical protein P8P20_02060 [Acidimicrobiales bacterium]|nr:hypothetical protein [Acidimicrobiales bacterium]
MTRLPAISNGARADREARFFLISASGAAVLVAAARFAVVFFAAGFFVAGFFVVIVVRKD